MAWSDVVNAIDGKPYTLDGVSGRMVVVRQRMRYEGHTLVTVGHVADAAGQKSAHYRALKEKMGDDWESDVTHSERLPEIAGNILGIAEADRLAGL